MSNLRRRISKQYGRLARWLMKYLRNLKQIRESFYILKKQLTSTKGELTLDFSLLPRSKLGVEELKLLGIMKITWFKKKSSLKSRTLNRLVKSSCLK